jgi:hypothetical protein
MDMKKTTLLEVQNPDEEFMNLPNNLFFEVPSLPGAGFILNVESPNNFIGKIYKFKDQESMAGFCRANFLDINLFKVPGYTIIIAPVGTLSGIDLPVQQRGPRAPQTITNSMINFYEKEYISNKKPAFKKYQD